jgi:peptide subunit release factor RF-3
MRESPMLTLLPLALRVRRRPGPLLPQIEAALAVHGRPLRWAITAVQGEELLLEAVLVSAP